MTEIIMEIRTFIDDDVKYINYSDYERRLQYIELQERIDRLFCMELRYNHNHDEKGRFCSGGGGGRFSSEKKLYSNGGANPEKDVDNSEKSDIIKTRNGKDRANDFSSNWSKASLNETIKKFGLDEESEVNPKGKVIYSNNRTNVTIVYDVNGNYFRIQDKTIPQDKRSAYLDINGNSAQNIVENSKTRGRTKKEFQRDTHFLNIDKKKE